MLSSEDNQVISSEKAGNKEMWAQPFMVDGARDGG
jgi:hypothetical protein